VETKKWDRKTLHRRFTVVEAPPPEPKISRGSLLFLHNTGASWVLVTEYTLHPFSHRHVSAWMETTRVSLAWNAYNIAVEVTPRGGRSETISKELADERAKEGHSYEEKEHSS